MAVLSQMSFPEYRMPHKLLVCLKGDTLQGETSRKYDSFQHIQKEKLWLVAAVMRHFVLTTIFPFHPLPFRHWQINFVVMWHDDGCISITNMEPSCIFGGMFNSSNCDGINFSWFTTYFGLLRKPSFVIFLKIRNEFQIWELYQANQAQQLKQFFKALCLSILRSFI